MIVQEEKICPRCKVPKKLKKFSYSKSTKDNLQSACKECKKLDGNKWRLNNQEYHIEYYQENQDKLSNYYKEWYIDNIEEVKEKQKKYQKDNPETFQKASKKWKQNNKSHVNNYMKNRNKTDIIFKLTNNLRNHLNRALKRKGNIKSKRTLELIGCTIEYFIQYIESQFKPEMNWSNHGTIWEIDHIKPCASFDFSDINNQNQCFHYTNLQPLFKTTKIAESFGYNEIGNRNKSNKVIT